MKGEYWNYDSITLHSHQVYKRPILSTTSLHMMRMAGSKFVWLKYCFLFPSNLFETLRVKTTKKDVEAGRETQNKYITKV